MSGAWSYRIVKDDKGKLHFAYVRFRPLENTISGATDIWNYGDNIEEMRRLAEELLRACDHSVIDLKDGHDSDSDEDDDEDEEDEEMR